MKKKCDVGVFFVSIKYRNCNFFEVAVDDATVPCKQSVLHVYVFLLVRARLLSRAAPNTQSVLDSLLGSSGFAQTSWGHCFSGRCRGSAQLCVAVWSAMLPRVAPRSSSRAPAARTSGGHRDVSKDGMVVVRDLFCRGGS